MTIAAAKTTSSLPTIEEHRQDASGTMSLQPLAAGDESGGAAAVAAKKSDSGVYFAMMLSEYLEKKPGGIEATNGSRGETESKAAAGEDSTPISELDSIKAQEAVANLSNVIWFVGSNACGRIEDLRTSR